MTKKELALAAVEELEKVYPDAVCSLTYEKPYELLISTRLSAQCTDARVNIVTEELFAKYPTLQSLAEADLADIEEIIKPCGLFRTKARDIIGIAQMLIANYGGQLPDSLEELVKLPGIGRKTANLIMGDIFRKPAVVTDTHCIRICGRLGLVSVKDPYKVEMALRELLPPEKSSDFCHRLVHFGREFCKAQNPQCTVCPLLGICERHMDFKK
ncbi:MAG TPA: endonuclease III [Candidatus Merdivicinus intestinavium]|nr:endonuclease III [Candidatus Merdivicinus intestinavium]